MCSLPPIAFLSLPVFAQHREPTITALRCQTMTTPKKAWLVRDLGRLKDQSLYCNESTEAVALESEIEQVELKIAACDKFDGIAKPSRKQRDNLRSKGKYADAARVEEQLKSLNKRSFVEEYVRNNMNYGTQNSAPASTGKRKARARDEGTISLTWGFRHCRP